MAKKKPDRFVIKENQGLGAVTPTHITPLLDANGNVVVDSAAQNTLE